MREKLLSDKAGGKMKGIPYIRFHNILGRLHIECDGETVGVFLPSLEQDRGELFMRKMENLKMLFSDELVDTFKYIKRIGEAK